MVKHEQMYPHLFVKPTGLEIRNNAFHTKATYNKCITITIDLKHLLFLAFM